MNDATTGNIDLRQLEKLAKAGEVDTVILAFVDLYGRLLGKRIDADFFCEDPSGTHVCDYLFTVDMEMEPVPGYAYSDWAGGYGDVHLVADHSTMRVLSWQDRTAFVMCDAHGPDGTLVPVAPRSILRRQIERCAEAGYTLKAASELEYYLYRTSFEDAATSGYAALKPAGWYIEDYHLLQGTRTEDLNGAFRRELKASGIPVESTKGEFGKGQHELNIRYCDALDMADRHVLLKQCVKEVADAKCASVTFMAKPTDLEAGSSSHLHMSLWRNGDAVFPADDPDPAMADLACTPEFGHFLAGLLAHTGELLPFLAPTINSYKRYQPQSWAPTSIAWSPDNRTAGFRVVGSGPALRIECRIPGADVNPYLAFAAMLAAGLDGLERSTACPAPHIGDAYASDEVTGVPTTLRAANELFAGSDFARAAFGDLVVDHYAHFFATEVAEAERAVTDWERKRYFERI